MSADVSVEGVPSVDDVELAVLDALEKFPGPVLSAPEVDLVAAAVHALYAPVLERAGAVIELAQQRQDREAALGALAARYREALIETRTYADEANEHGLHMEDAEPHSPLARARYYALRAVETADAALVDPKGQD